MKTSQQFTVTLPRELAEQIERKVASGSYASANQVLQEGVRVLLDRDAAMETWLRE